MDDPDALACNVVAAPNVMCVPTATPVGVGVVCVA